MIRFRPPSDELLRRVLEDQRARPFSYPAIGATAGGSDCPVIPEGYRQDRVETDLGADDSGRWERAREALVHWAPQRGAGIRVYPGQPVTLDAAFVLALPLPGAGWAVAPGRVVYLRDERDRFGFAYGTLPAHPASGEEAFTVLRGDGQVRFEVTAFSRPQDRLARFGAPVARALQVRTIGAYLRAMAAATR